MKFYGIDCLGYLKLQAYQGSIPSFVTASDERRFVYLDDGVDDALYVGGDRANDWVRVVLDDGAGYPSLIGELDTVYHPVGGDVTVPFTSSTITGSNPHGGSGVDAVRATDDWLKLGDSSPLTGSEQAGIRIEYGSPSSDLDDIKLFYDHDAPDSNGFAAKWQFDGGGYVNEPIATHEWVNNAITTGVSTSWTKQEVDDRFVRYADLGEEGTYGNTTWGDWAQLTEDQIGDNLTTQRQIYRKNEIYHSYVRVGPASGSVTENVPKTSGGGLWVETDNVATASSVVYRNSSSNIYANLFIGTATSARYADLAEKYTCDEDLAVGTVVEVSDDDYEVAPCMFELSPSVVGVVSENPAHLMNADSEGLPIALTGKVPVRVIGEVLKGDFLVAAGDGLARKGEPSELSFKIGLVLKTDLHSGEKLVECIIK